MGTNNDHNTTIHFAGVSPATPKALPTSSLGSPQKLQILKVGQQFRLPTPETDEDHLGQERVTPAGATWTVKALEPENDPVMQYSAVCEATGGWIFINHAELEMSGCELLEQANAEQPEVEYLEYLKSLPLKDALWWFIENVPEDHSTRTALFFALRERVRTE